MVNGRQCFESSSRNCAFEVRAEIHLTAFLLCGCGLPLLFGELLFLGDSRQLCLFELKLQLLLGWFFFNHFFYFPFRISAINLVFTFSATTSMTMKSRKLTSLPFWSKIQKPSGSHQN